MGLFEKIFGVRPKKEVITASPDYKFLTAYTPQFLQRSGQLYETELIRAAINARATHIGKLKVEFFGHGSAKLAARLRRPNEFSTWSQFLARVSTILDTQNTCLIVPAFDEFNRVKAIYPVLPQSTKVVENNGEPWVAFRFGSGRYAQLPVYQVAVMRKMQYKDELFGESNDALKSTMQLIEIQNQGITEGIKSSATFRFMATMTNFIKSEDLKKERQRFDQNNLSGDGGGILLFPNTYSNVQKIDSKPYVIDAAQMAIIKENIFSYMGVNDDVLMNRTFGDKWTAFYEGAIEPFAVQFSEVMTNMFILCGELEGTDAGVMATANRLQYMSNAEKLNVSSQLADRGVLNRDEVREIWNLPPLPNDEGKQYIIRGEYYNAAEKVSEGSDEDG